MSAEDGKQRGPNYLQVLMEAKDATERGEALSRMQKKAAADMRRNPVTRAQLVARMVKFVQDNHGSVARAKGPGRSAVALMVRLSGGRIGFERPCSTACVVLAGPAPPHLLLSSFFSSSSRSLSYGVCSPRTLAPSTLWCSRHVCLFFSVLALFFSVGISAWQRIYRTCSKSFPSVVRRASGWFVISSLRRGFEMIDR